MLGLWILATVWITSAAPANSLSGDGAIDPDPSHFDLRLVGDGNSSRGELQAYILNLGWVNFCSEGFGYFEAQVACSVLGYPFFLEIYEILQTNERPRFTSPDCSSEVSNGYDASISGCDYTLELGSGFCDAERVVGLMCDDRHDSAQDLALVAFYHEFKFQYIDPSNGYYFTNCYVADLFCSGVHLVNVSASSELQTIIFGWNFLSAGGGQVGCGVFCASHFTVSHSCIPEPGDVYVGHLDMPCNEDTVVSSSGELKLYSSEGEWVEVCAETFGYVEAYVVCKRLSYPTVEEVYQVDRSLGHHAIEGIECNGTESSAMECNIHGNISNCSHTVGIICGGNWASSAYEGYAAVVFEGTQTLQLTVITPERGFYKCAVGESEICPGVYHIESTEVELLINTSQSPSSSGDPCFIPELSHSDIPGGRDCTIPGTSSPSSSSSSTAVTGGIVAGLLCVVIAASLLVVVVLVVRRRRQQLGRRQEWKMMWPNPTERPTQYRMLTFQHQTVCRRGSVNPGLVVDDTNWEIPFRCITLGEEVGSGAYGSIHRGEIACEHQKEPIEVAVKLLKRQALESERKALVMEIEMMKDIGYHRHVVSMLACCTRDDYLALVMEYVPYGNLQSFLKKNRAESEDPYTSNLPTRYTPQREMERKIGESVDGKESTSAHETPGVCKAKGKLSDIELVQFARQITLGMEYLSSLKIVHRDLAARNILIDKDLILKVSDFGLSRDIYSDQCYHMESVKDRLPVRWMAPESIIDRDFTVASDVWSFGITLWEIVTYASFPYFNLSNTEVIEDVKNGYRMPKPSGCPDEVYDVMLSCWALRPKDRPSFTELRNMLDSFLDHGEYTSLLGLSFSKPNDHSGLETVEEVVEIQ